MHAIDFLLIFIAAQGLLARSIRSRILALIRICKIPKLHNGECQSHGTSCWSHGLFNSRQAVLELLRLHLLHLHQ